MELLQFYVFLICIIFCENELFLFFKCPVSITAYKGLAKQASIVCPTSVFGLPVLPVANVTWPNWHASKEQATFACRQAKMLFDSVLADIQNAEQEMFEKFGGGETSASKNRLFKLSCQANNVSQCR